MAEEVKKYKTWLACQRGWSSSSSYKGATGKLWGTYSAARHEAEDCQGSKNHVFFFTSVQFFCCSWYAQAHMLWGLMFCMTVSWPFRTLWNCTCSLRIITGNTIICWTLTVTVCLQYCTHVGSFSTYAFSYACYSMSLCCVRHHKETSWWHC